MILAFYRVENSRDFAPESFEGLEPSQILNKLQQLDPYEWYAYDTNCKKHDSHAALMDFVSDYNNEILDCGGFWCVLIETDF